jgi:transcriptional regulator with XRE-family HTH domain
VKVLRVWRGMTQAALATAAGITSTYLSRVENGTDAGNKARRAIAAALEVPETMLLEK